MKIAEVSEKFGLSVDTLRYYERVGLIPPVHRNSGWFRGTETLHEGHIRAGGVSKDVTFRVESDPDTNEQIDAAYRAKYRRYAASIINSTLTSEARSATLKLVPR